MTKILDCDNSFLNAALALDVYRDPARPLIPTGWSIYMDCPIELQSDGYFGAAYYSSYSINNQTTGINIVIAHRGTANKAGLIEDIEMYLFHEVPVQFKNSALPFMEKIIDKINVDFPINPEKFKYNSVIWGFTGHSLGGALAELSTAYFASLSELKYIKKYPDASLPITVMFCHSFESPGSEELISVLTNEKLINQNGINWLNNILDSFVADIDAINTALTHVGGYMNIVNVGYDWLPDKTGKLPMAPNLTYYLKQYTIADQHKMKKMYAALQNQNSGILCLAENWPQGAGAGYHSFMQYNSSVYSAHAQWWDGYMQRLWQQYPELQSQYTYPDGSPDYYTFSTFYISQYLSLDTLTIKQPEKIISSSIALPNKSMIVSQLLQFGFMTPPKQITNLSNEATAITEHKNSSSL